MHAVYSPWFVSNKLWFSKFSGGCCRGVAHNHNKNHEGWPSHDIGSRGGNFYGAVTSRVSVAGIPSWQHHYWIVWDLHETAQRSKLYFLFIFKQHEMKTKITNSCDICPYNIIPLDCFTGWFIHLWNLPAQRGSLSGINITSTFILSSIAMIFLTLFTYSL